MRAGGGRVPASGLRVALCFGTFPPERNGGSDFVANLATALGGMGCDVHVLTSYRELETAESTPANVSVHRIIDNWTLMHGRASLERANRIIEREGIDVLHVLFPDSVISHEYELPALIGFNRVPLVTTFWRMSVFTFSVRAK